MLCRLAIRSSLWQCLCRTEAISIGISSTHWVMSEFVCAANIDFVHYLCIRCGECGLRHLVVNVAGTHCAQWSADLRRFTAKSFYFTHFRWSSRNARSASERRPRSYKCATYGKLLRNITFYVGPLANLGHINFIL